MEKSCINDDKKIILRYFLFSTEAILKVHRVYLACPVHFPVLSGSNRIDPEKLLPEIRQIIVSGKECYLLYRGIPALQQIRRLTAPFTVQILQNSHFETFTEHFPQIVSTAIQFSGDPGASHL